MSVRKFQFDESFDVDQPRRRRKAEPEPEPMPEPEPEPVEPPPPTFSEAELEAAKRAAYAEGERAGQGAGYGKGFAEGINKGLQDGQAKGKLEAEATIEFRIATATERLAAGVDALLRDRAVSNAMRADQPFHLALAMVAKLMPEMTRRHGLAEIEGAVRGLLSELIDEPRLVIRVAPDIVAPVRERLEAMAASHGFSAKLAIMDEPGVPPGDCRIEWAEGGAERDTAGLMAAIRDRAAPLLDHPEALSLVSSPEN
jgi:flagellar assembly protein FliH